MGEKREGEKLLDQRGLTPELAVALRAIVVRVAGHRFRSAGRLADAMVRQIWNPWNFFGGLPYIRAVANNITRSSELFDQLGVAKVEVSNARDRAFRRRNTVLYLVDPMPSGRIMGVNTPTQAWPIVGTSKVQLGEPALSESESAEVAELSGETTDN
jgi:hypothetical protein